MSAPDTSALPERLAPMSPLNPARAVRERVLAITEMDRPSDGYTMIGLLGQKHWDDPITEDPAAGSMEIWSFANTTGDVHPIHTHLVRFQVLNRQTFDVQTYLADRQIGVHGNPTAAGGERATGLEGHRQDVPRHAHESDSAVRSSAGHIRRCQDRSFCTSGIATSSSTKTTR